MKPLIPEAALKKHIAILGMNGSGKTSVAKSQVIEPALDAGDRVCNIDPTGVGWGLRLSRSGKSKGFDIYIVGGDHADFQLVSRDGKAWGEIVGTSSDSFVFDTSQMTVGDRSQWFTDFAETLLRKNKGPLTFVLDEAHLFAPQGGASSGGIAPRMLHATNNLLALGRSRGLRITMISQRPAKLHKDSLTQAHTMVAMMMTSPQDRGAVKDWIADQADAEKGKEIVSSLPSLAPGDGWVWAPREKVLERVKFPLPHTFDSSSAPDEEEGEGPTLSPINPDAIKARLETVAKETVANDPTKLRAEIARLTRELAAKPSAPAVDVSAIKDAAYLSGISSGSSHIAGIIGELQHDIQTALAKHSLEASRLAAKAFDESQKSGSLQSPVKAATTPKPARTAAPPARAPSPVASGNGGTLTPSLQRVVNAIGWWRKIGFDPIERARASVVAGFSPKASTFGVYIAELVKLGLVATSAGKVGLTEDGWHAAVVPEADTADELYTVARGLLGAQEAKVFDVIYNAHPDEIARKDVAEQVGLSPTASTTGVYIAGVAAFGIIETSSPGHVKAAEWLFP